MADIPNSVPANGGNAATVNNHTVNSDVPANAVFTDNNTTYQFEQDGNTLKMGTNNGTKSVIYSPVLEVEGDIPVYESLSASEGGSSVSLVTTGEKYTWNNKQDALQFNTAYNASSNKVATMSDIPTVPTKVSDLNNDSGFTTNTGTVTGVTVGSTAYTPTNGVVTIPAYPTVPQSYAYGDISYTVNKASVSGTVNNIDGTIPLHLLTASNDVTSFALSTQPAYGHSCHVIFTASSTDKTVSIAHDSTYRICPDGVGPLTFTVPAGGYVEVDFLNLGDSSNGDKVFVRGIQ